MANVKLKCADFLVDVSYRLELLEAMLIHQDDISYNEEQTKKERLSAEVCEIVGEQLDSLVSSMRLFAEDLENEQERVNATV